MLMVVAGIHDEDFYRDVPVLLFCCRGRARQVQEAEVKLTSHSFELSKVEADEATQSDWLWGTGGGATIHRAGKIPVRLQF